MQIGKLGSTLASYEWDALKLCSVHRADLVKFRLHWRGSYYFRKICAKIGTAKLQRERLKSATNRDSCRKEFWSSSPAQYVPIFYIVDFVKKRIPHAELLERLFEFFSRYRDRLLSPSFNNVKVGIASFSRLIDINDRARLARTCVFIISLRKCKVGIRGGEI
jgi:hypothetical protein